MRCSLQDVDVYEMRELTLDSWRDVEGFIDAAQASHNRELWDLIAAQNLQLRVCRNVVKDVCSPMSELLRREHDGMTALHLAAAVRDNLPCLQLVCAGLKACSAGARDNVGRTALQVSPFSALLPLPSSFWSERYPFSVQSACVSSRRPLGAH